MKILRPLGVMALVVISTVAVGAETGDLKIRFEYAGAAVEPSALNINKDAEFCGKTKLVNEKLLVNKENKGIKNVVVYVYTGRGGSKLKKVDPVNATHELANDKCRFEPRVVIAQSGDKLKVTNPDAVGHNANFSFFNNKAVNVTIPAGEHKIVDVDKNEPAPIPVECNIHPWMRAYVVVLDHPFA
ncbi:MAG: methylamine utilization protein, partial [Pirellulales bacterium]|nr:methylamine utilization protein [Pirellulales bacterium]